MQKRRHHYVWKKYLEPWTTDGQIWCLTNGEIFRTNPKNVGQARDFYKLKELSDEDIAFIFKLATAPGPPLLEELNGDWIKSFNSIFKVKRWVKDQRIGNCRVNAWYPGGRVFLVAYAQSISGRK